MAPMAPCRPSPNPADSGAGQLCNYGPATDAVLSWQAPEHRAKVKFGGPNPAVVNFWRGGVLISIYSNTYRTGTLRAIANSMQ